MADVAESGSQDTMFADEETGQYLSARYIVVTRSASTGIPISHFVCVCVLFFHPDSGNNEDEDTLEPVTRELPEELVSGSEGQTSDSDCLVMSSKSVHGASVPQVDHIVTWIICSIQHCKLWSIALHDCYVQNINRCQWYIYFSRVQHKFQ